MSELTAGQVLAQVDSILPNACSREEKLRWLRQAAGMIVQEVLQPLTEECITLSEEMGESSALPNVQPYDELYRCYVEAQIHYAAGDTVRCGNAMALWNRMLDVLQCKLLRESSGKTAKHLRFF